MSRLKDKGDRRVMMQRSQTRKPLPVFVIVLIWIVSLIVSWLMIRTFIVEFPAIIYPSGREERGVVYKLEYKFRLPAEGEQVLFVLPSDRRRHVGFVGCFPNEAFCPGDQEISDKGRFLIKKGKMRYWVPLKDIIGRRVDLSSKSEK